MREVTFQLAAQSARGRQTTLFIRMRANTCAHNNFYEYADDVSGIVFIINALIFIYVFSIDCKR